MARTATVPEQAPEISDYALIGDCRTAALVSRSGSIDWLCLPHFSGPSVFAAILDGVKGGRFSISPAETFRAERRYVGATAVLQTSFETASGKARLTDCMPVGEERGSLSLMREVLRTVEGVEGEMSFEVCCEPRPNYARVTPLIEKRGRFGHAVSWGDEILLLRSEAELEILSGGAIGARIRVAAGQTLRFSLGYAKSDIAVIAPLGEGADRRMRSTLEWWTGWSGGCRYEGPHREMVVRNAVTLKLMTFALSGAVVAAPTSSLPEAIGADRNWDYRFCWLRDAALTMKAFNGLGFREEAGAFLRWLLHATRLTWPRLQVMYDVYGRVDLVEEELDGFSGYGGSRPVRIGNGAHDQVQHDVYGGVISAALDFVNTGGKLQADESKLLAGLGDTVIRTWREPDHGIWEIRDPKRQYVFSKVMCWAALDGLLRLNRLGAISVDAAHLAHERDVIAALIETEGFDAEIGSYVSELGGRHLDAAILLMPSVGYKPAGDPRVRSTYDRIQERLGRDGLLYRYEDGYDEGPSLEGAFGICSFWAVDGLARRGDVDEAERSFRHLLSFANDVGLLAEEIEVGTGSALGNFPQAFTHVGLINAALAIEAARTAQVPAR